LYRFIAIGQLYEERAPDELARIVKSLRRYMDLQSASDAATQRRHQPTTTPAPRRILWDTIAEIEMSDWVKWLTSRVNR